MFLSHFFPQMLSSSADTSYAFVNFDAAIPTSDRSLQKSHIKLAQRDFFQNQAKQQLHTILTLETKINFKDALVQNARASVP